MVEAWCRSPATRGQSGALHGTPAEKVQLTLVANDACVLAARCNRSSGRHDVVQLLDNAHAHRDALVAEHEPAEYVEVFECLDA
jgi:hypothetical protein